MCRLPLLVVLLALLACSNGAQSVTTLASSTTTSQPTTTTRPTTTTTRPTTTTLAGFLSPMNGLPVTDAALLDRRVMAVKIDNAPGARPQSGLNEADAVIELLVESGVTRFIALFHDADSAYLGPMRSGRPTDPTLLAPLGATFAISGAQPWVLSQIRKADVPMIGEERPATFRISGRRAPHNLYVDTTLLRKIADDRAYPDQPPTALFEFGVMPSDAEPATEVEIGFSDGTRVLWTYANGSYTRHLNGVESSWISKDGAKGPISTDTLVVLFGRRYTANPPGGNGTPVPAMDMTGEGRAIVFAGGKVVEGGWERAGTDVWFELVDERGGALAVPAGIPWISLVPNGRRVDW